MRKIQRSNDVQIDQEADCARRWKTPSSSTAGCSAIELVKRPASLDFKGAWLHKYGMGIHLLHRDGAAGCIDDIPTRPPAAINPKGNHISFQCSDMALMKARLQAMDREFVVRRVWDGETVVDQLFFHDPDGNVIEICNCENLPVIPLDVVAVGGAAGLPELPVQTDVHG
ncbi:hypothetical protein GUJ93_ZPchr0014g47260 [Zizania palustris]|uniref:VOC domain-containing protein n=1 Tax=Zizania palustris TaxID=103762 RepID=A0A8J5W6W8_ZIZPA|nr:hypothetical protein GUJ93_ZPchr0014g47260 [Zizania palustris]